MGSGWCARLLVAALAFGTMPAFAQNAADSILVGGKIVTLDEAGSIQEALAVRDGRVLATGGAAAIRALAGTDTRVIDLAGRTVIPGLIDSHMHAIRTALFYATEVNWIGTHSIADATERIRAASAAAKPGQWIIVAGGWTPQQFAEKRRPTQGEILAAAPTNPVYIQFFYGAALLTPAGFTALNIASDADVPPHGKIARDAAGTRAGGSFTPLRLMRRCKRRGPRTNCRDRARRHRPRGWLR
jgi:predicted amidohydrolase YtcJ